MADANNPPVSNEDNIDTAGCHGDVARDDNKFSDWMSNLPPRLCSEPLKNIAIPGEIYKCQECCKIVLNMGPILS